jgi:transposase InsO family protein
MIGLADIVKPKIKLELIIIQRTKLQQQRPLDMLHIDLFGPIAYISIDGNKYGLIIVDDYSYFTWVLFLHDKSET